MRRHFVKFLTSARFAADEARIFRDKFTSTPLKLTSSAFSSFIRHSRLDLSGSYVVGTTAKPDAASLNRLSLVRTMASIVSAMTPNAEEAAPPPSTKTSGKRGHDVNDDSDGDSDKEYQLKRPRPSMIEPPEVPDLKLEPLSEEIRKRKVAILVAYCGSGYYGLQVNPGLRTIEGDFAKALLNSGLISEDNFADLKPQTGFQRASRTDKGVSAAGNVFSMKMKAPDDAVQRLNRCLPPQIRVLGVVKVTKGFDSKNSVNSRTYLYLLPTFSFAPFTVRTDKNYRTTPEIIQNVNKLFDLYKGTRNYHNFTSGKLPTDPSAKRFVMCVSCGDPFVVEGLEMAVITVRGQSFMLHQIRKMIGLVIGIARGVADLDCLKRLVWGPKKVDIPKAPGLGLMLEKLHYDTYNRKFGNDGIHQPLDWDDHKDQMDSFKLEQVFAHIAKTESELMEMSSWLSTLTLHSYDVKEIGPVYLDDAAKATTIHGAQVKNGDEKMKDDVNGGDEKTVEDVIGDVKTEEMGRKEDVNLNVEKTSESTVNQNELKNEGVFVKSSPTWEEDSDR